ncbi:hypothetical protein [Rhizobium sp. 9140]|uniref:hypothetical protein n=1 Tax=Rhizobium sp. 9140 TaxID=1761900 RepID=UPI00079C30C8|nr:hypothetical protein [Rhizobium sp. 9140]CZT35498.1 hypothetical protein GA0004734_00025070 [Rhizobium sp. 9140]
MNSNIIHFKTRTIQEPAELARYPIGTIIRIVRAIIDRQKLAATRRITRRQLRNLPTVVRRDIGIFDVNDHQEC